MESDGQRTVITENDQNDESCDEIQTTDEKHKALLRIDLGSNEKAVMICRTLTVDKEPSRSTAKRAYSVDGQYLVVEIMSTDVKYLQKSIDNLFDMCYLAKQTIEQVAEYRLKVTSNTSNCQCSEACNRSKRTKK